jgi:hypothetical protein
MTQDSHIQQVSSFDINSNLALAWFFLFIGMICNAVLWSSLALGGLSYMMGALGIGFDLAKVRILYNATSFYYSRNWLPTIGYGIGFVVMTLLSMFAAAGFYALSLTETRQEAVLSSYAYQEAKQRYEQAQADLATLAMYAHINLKQLREQKEQALNQIYHQTALNMNGRQAGLVKTRVGNCQDTNYYTRRYCPEITRTQQEFENQIQGVLAYQAVINRLELAKADMQESQQHISTGIPIFSMVGHLLATSEESSEEAEQEVYTAFVMITAIVTEALASLLFLAARLLGRDKLPSVEEMYRARMAEIQMLNKLIELQSISGNKALPEHLSSKTR